MTLILNGGRFFVQLRSKCSTMNGQRLMMYLGRFLSFFTQILNQIPVHPEKPQISYAGLPSGGDSQNHVGSLSTKGVVRDEKLKARFHEPFSSPVRLFGIRPCCCKMFRFRMFLLSFLLKPCCDRMLLMLKYSVVSL